MGKITDFGLCFVPALGFDLPALALTGRALGGVDFADDRQPRPSQKGDARDILPSGSH